MEAAEAAAAAAPLQPTGADLLAQFFNLLAPRFTSNLSNARAPSYVNHPNPYDAALSFVGISIERTSNFLNFLVSGSTNGDGLHDFEVVRMRDVDCSLSGRKFGPVLFTELHVIARVLSHVPCLSLSGLTGAF